MNPNVNDALWVIGCVHVSSSVIIDVSFWCWMLMVGKAVYVWGQGVYRNSLYCLLNFAVTLKVLLKIVYFLKGEWEVKPG